MLTIEQLCAERVLKARTEITMRQRFYGAAIANVTPVVSREVPTAATDSKTHFWNPDYVATLDQEELLFVQAHETGHDVRHHSTRRGSRDPDRWNRAGDYNINGDLIAEGIGRPPKGVLVDKAYFGMATEDIYRVLEGLETKQPEQPDEPEDEPEQDEQDKPEQGEAEQPGQGEEEGDAGQDETQPEDGENEHDNQDGNAPGKPAGEPGEEGGEDSGEGPAEASQEAPGGAGEAENSGETATEAAGDIGGTGWCLDAPGDTNDVAEQDLQWTKVVKEAELIAKGCGQLPGWVTREIESANNPPRNWRDELREFCEAGALTIETWNRPNRRHVSRGVILPSNQKDGVSKAAFLIDTSGSMDKIALACVRDEAQQLLDDGIINEAVVIYGDVAVTRVDEYQTGDEIEFDPKGGGGTNMKPLFDHVEDELSDVTDLEFYEDLGEVPNVPVLFAVHGHDPRRVKNLMERAPWEARCIDVGAH
jgi:predicted metal-dependent peptidase